MDVHASGGGQEVDRPVCHVCHPILNRFSLFEVDISGKYDYSVIDVDPATLWMIPE